MESSFGEVMALNSFTAGPLHDEVMGAVLSLGSAVPPDESPQVRKVTTLEGILSEGLDRELTASELAGHHVSRISVFLPLGLAVAGLNWMLSRALDAEKWLVAEERYDLSASVAKGFGFYTISMSACSLTTLLYFTIASPVYDSRSWLSKLLMAAARLFFIPVAWTVWVANTGTPGVTLGMLLWTTTLRVVFFSLSEVKYLRMLAHKLWNPGGTTVLHEDGISSSACCSSGRYCSGRQHQHWGNFLSLLAAMMALFMWVWLWLILSLLIFPQVLHEVRSSSRRTANGISIVYPILAQFLMTQGFKLFSKELMRETQGQVDVHYSAMILAGIIAEFVCKQAAYSATKVEDTAHVLVGQMITEILFLWATPHLLALWVKLRRLIRRGCALGYQRCGGDVNSADEVDLDSRGQAEEGKAEEGAEIAVHRSLSRRNTSEMTHDIMVLAACSADTRNCMEYIGHCGVVVAKYVGDGGLSGWDMAQALLLGVSLEVVSDLMGALGRRVLGFKGLGRYTLPLTWQNLLMIAAFSTEVTQLCMMRPFCVLAW